MRGRAGQDGVKEALVVLVARHTAEDFSLSPSRGSEHAQGESVRQRLVSGQVFLIIQAHTGVSTGSVLTFVFLTVVH